VPSLILVTPGIRANLVSERLRVEIPPEEGESEPRIRDIPLKDVEQLVIGERVHLSIPALSELLQRDISVAIVRGQSERIVGYCTPPPKMSVARLAQYRKSEDPAFTRDIAAGVVAAKIRNQRRVLQRLSANRAEGVVAAVLRRLEQAANRAAATPAGKLDELLGIEGAAASDYFEALAAFFPPDVPMNGRTRRPPRDPPNAVLSYGYAPLAAQLTGALTLDGLDPAIGFLHDPAERRAALALDLMEPFRPVIADALAVDLFSHRMLDPAEHFDREGDGVHLNAEGRKKFHGQYERRMTREFRIAPSDPPTTLRQCLRAQAFQMRQAILGEGEWQPYRMP